MDLDKFYAGSKTVLKSISVHIKPGSKVCVVGRSGAGVSLFMLSISGQTILSKGQFKLNGSLSYLSVDHEFFVAGTIKENVIMGEKFDPVKFAKILDILELDLGRFPAGEQMEILPNTENISTDEKKKLLLARVLY